MLRDRLGERQLDRREPGALAPVTGTRPACRNQASASVGPRPAAMTLSAMPGDHLVAAVGDRGEAVHHGEPDSRTAIPASTPSQAQSVVCATAAAANAAAQHLALEGDVDHARCARRTGRPWPPAPAASRAGSCCPASGGAGRKTSSPIRPAPRHAGGARTGPRAAAGTCSPAHPRTGSPGPGSPRPGRG